MLLLLLLLTLELGLETCLSRVIESEGVAGEDPEQESVDSRLRNQTVLRREVNSEVHDRHTGHTERTAG